MFIASILHPRGVVSTLTIFTSKSIVIIMLTCILAHFNETFLGGSVMTFLPRSFGSLGLPLSKTCPGPMLV